MNDTQHAARTLQTTGGATNLPIAILNDLASYGNLTDLAALLIHELRHMNDRDNSHQPEIDRGDVYGDIKKNCLN